LKKMNSREQVLAEVCQGNSFAHHEEHDGHEGLVFGVLKDSGML